MGEKSPVVSVLMPAYRAESTLLASATSILRQTLHDLELVIVDDGSDDRTADVAEALVRDDARVRVLRRPHEGIVAALNAGVAACRADLIARMDADDFALPLRLELQCYHLEAPLDAVGCQVRIVDPQGAPAKTMRRYEAWVNAHTSPESIHAYRFVESPLVHPTVLARRAVFELGYRQGDFPEDYELWLRALQAGFRFAKVETILLHWTRREGQLTRTDPRYRVEAFDATRRRYLLEGPLHGVPTVDLWGAGLTGKPWLRWLHEVGRAVRKLYDVAPRKIGQRIHGVRILSKEELCPPDGVPLIVAVGAAGAREEILAHLQPLGYRPGIDVWCVA